MRTIIEPFRIKSVEPLHFTTPAERERFLEAAGYNLFQIPAAQIPSLLEIRDEYTAERVFWVPP